MYLDDCQFAEAAFKNGLGPRLHFVSISGYKQHAKDVDDVWAESQARIASGEASQYGHNHASSSPGASGSGSSTNVASSFGSASTVDTKADSAKGLATSGKRGNPEKESQDHSLVPGPITAKARRESGSRTSDYTLPLLLSCTGSLRPPAGLPMRAST